MNSLLKLKQRLDEAKAEARSLEGRRDALMDQLKENHNCVTIEEAEELLEETEAEKDKLEKKLETRLNAFKKKYKGLLEDEDEE